MGQKYVFKDSATSLLSVLIIQLSTDNYNKKLTKILYIPGYT